jgi:hypothetical protein
MVREGDRAASTPARGTERAEPWAQAQSTEREPRAPIKSTTEAPLDGATGSSGRTRALARGTTVALPFLRRSPWTVVALSRLLCAALNISEWREVRERIARKRRVGSRRCVLWRSCRLAAVVDHRRRCDLRREEGGEEENWS